jgi:hypothetical protein
MKIIMEKNNYSMASIPKVRMYGVHNEKSDYHARILITICSDAGSTQVQFISNETKSDWWAKEDLSVAFNHAYVNIKRIAETGGYINLFDENLFFEEKENIEFSENESIELELSDDKPNFQRLNEDLAQIKECRDNFKACKDKLYYVISWLPSTLNYNYANINTVTNYLYQVVEASVVNAKNKEYLHNYKTALFELKGRKDTQHYNYITNMNIAQRDIYSLEFPQFFKSTLPRTDIKSVLDEIR